MGFIPSLFSASLEAQIKRFRGFVPSGSDSEPFLETEGQMGRPSSSCSSSGEEDGDAEWKAAIFSVSDTTFGVSKASNDSVANPASAEGDDVEQKQQPQNVKLYQIKAQKILDDILEKRLLVVRDSISVLNEEPITNEGGVRLFKNAPRGIVFDHADEFERPKKKPRLLPGEEIDEKSNEFKRRIRSVVVEGDDIIAAARNVCLKARARVEAKDAATKAAAKREEERVAQLKKLRGEKWLPSIARQMRQNTQRLMY